MVWRFYCTHCGKIKNRFQVAKGTDGIRFYWYRCRECGTKVLTLKEALESVIKANRRLVEMEE